MGAVQTAWYGWQRRAPNPIVVYQMARVGSVTVTRALRAAFPDRPVFHTHYLHPDSIRRAGLQHQRVNRVSGGLGLHREYMGAVLLRRRLEKEHDDWRIVSLVRDPVARTVSAFFRHLPFNEPELGAGFRGDVNNVPRMLEMFLDKNEPERRTTLEWFDREVEGALGLDVFGSPFPRERGFARYQLAVGELLVIRLEDLDRCGARALADFLETPSIELTSVNRAGDLGYGEAYRRFLEQVRLPRDYLDEMYDSRLARHFYDDDERRAFRARWERRGAVEG